MVLKSSGEVIGDCGLTRQTVDGVEEIEIGYHVRRDLWGRGLAPEAARLPGLWLREATGRAAHLSDPAGELAFAAGSGKDRVEPVEGGNVEGLPHCVYVIRRE